MLSRDPPKESRRKLKRKCSFIQYQSQNLFSKEKKKKLKSPKIDLFFHGMVNPNY